MVSLGYIRQEKDSKRYRVGRPLFALAASSLDEIEMVSVATPVLEDLARETGESSHFAVRMGDAVVVIARTSGPGAFQLTDRVGVVRPALHGARRILASLRDDPAQRFLERVELAPSTDKSITEIPVLLREIGRSGAAASRSTTANSISRSAAWRCPSRASPARPSVPSASPGRSWRLSLQALQSRAKVVQPRLIACRRRFGARVSCLLPAGSAERWEALALTPPIPPGISFNNNTSPLIFSHTEESEGDVTRQNREGEQP